MIQDLHLGARYPTFKALEAAVEKFSRETNSVYIVCHSRSVVLENKARPPNKQIPVCLKYKNIKFACKHYGKTRSSSRGLRPNQRSFKIGCPSFIYVSANTKELVVEKIETNHSHSCDPELVALYPERRSLAHARCDDSDDDSNSSGYSLKNVREDVLDLMALGVERRRILNYVWITTGRKLFSGDLTNIAKDVKDQPRTISDERRDTLLENLKAMESRQNGDSYKPQSKLIGLKAMKRKVPFPSDAVVKTEIINNDDSSEQCYSVIETDQEGQMYDNTMYISDPMQLVSQGNLNSEDIQYHYENQDENNEGDGHENDGATWNENSSLADVVKSILGPNQEGPVILHVNNYDGVAVVQVADPHSYSASEDHEAEAVLDRSQPEEVECIEAEQQSTSQLIVRKSVTNKKPLVVTAVPTNSKKNVSNNNLLRSAQLKGSNSAVKPKPFLKQTHEASHDTFSEEGNVNSMEDDSDTQSDHRSVLEDERTLYRVKTKKIRLQIDSLKHSIEKQDLEKRKLQLEIKLLKMKVDEKESQSKQVEAVPDKRKKN